MDERYYRFFELFNEHEFYECHEVLEDLWLETFGDDRPYYQGLIQTATAFYHLENGNWGGSRKLFESGLRYLEPYPEQFQGFELVTYRQACRTWHDLAKRRQRGEEVEIDADQFPILEVIRG